MTDDLVERVALSNITAEQVREIFSYNPDTGIVIYRKRTSQRTPPGTVAGSLNKHGYLTVKVLKRNALLHRVIWLMMTGEWPAGLIDHIDRDRTNNRWNNLRVVDAAQNAWNSQKPEHIRTKTGIPGVKRRWAGYTVDISVRGKKIYIGSFKTLEEATAAREAAVLKYHGPIAAAIRALVKEP